MLKPFHHPEPPSHLQDEDEKFLLKWLNTKDIYEALNPSFIEEFRLQKMPSSFKDKGKAVMEEPEKEEDGDVNEEQFQRDLLHAKMISRLHITMSEGEPSNIGDVDVEDGLFEEELVDYEPSPSHTQTILAYDFEGEENEEEIVYELVVGMEAVGGEKEDPAEPTNTLSVKVQAAPPESETEKLPETELVLGQSEELQEPTPEFIQTGELQEEARKSPSKQVHIEETVELNRSVDSEMLPEEETGQYALEFVRGVASQLA